MKLRVTRQTTGWNVGDLIEADEKRARQLVELEEAILVEGQAFTEEKKPEPVKEEVENTRGAVHFEKPVNQGGKHVNKN